MTEKDIQTRFGKWLSENWHSSAGFELKLVKGKSFPFDAVKDHQVEALLKVKHDGLYHKISDSPIFSGQKTRYTYPKPFDCLVLSGHAYLVICFYVPRQRKTCYAVDIDDFVSFRNLSPRKSVTEQELTDIASLELEL